jgi:DNA-binding SARP family transcriptional activator
MLLPIAELFGMRGSRLSSHAGGSMGDSAKIVGQIQLMLLGGFTLLHDSEEILLPLSAQRLIAFLALRNRPLSRSYLASTLWPDCPAGRSQADLRTALWRAKHCGAAVLVTSGMYLRLHAVVQVDVRLLGSLGHGPSANAQGMTCAESAGISWSELSLDLLPGWDDDWLVDDREDVRQLRLHSLEHLSEELSAHGRHSEAIRTALAAVRLEPLRETAHAALIKAHLAEGNRSEALRQFLRCQELLATELAVQPSEWIRQLIPIPWLQAPDWSSDPADAGNTRELAGILKRLLREPGGSGQAEIRDEVVDKRSEQSLHC